MMIDQNEGYSRKFTLISNNNQLIIEYSHFFIQRVSSLTINTNSKTKFNGNNPKWAYAQESV